MSRDEPLVRAKHLVDATIVGGITFFAILLGDAVIAWSGGSTVYVTATDVAARLLTAGLAFCLTFLAQWGRARGIDFLDGLTSWLPGGGDP